MPRERLLPILREFAEYPEKYRVMMWKTLLKLPDDYESFAILLKQNLISSVSNYDKRFPHIDHKAMASLKQIVSCLIHWTPVFENVKYLPKFVFPFLSYALKINKGDLLFVFELITTLLLNHCQLWFEFLPSMEMPHNYLNVVENVLMEMDKKLYKVINEPQLCSIYFNLYFINFSSIYQRALQLSIMPFHLWNLLFLKSLSSHYGCSYGTISLHLSLIFIFFLSSHSIQFIVMLF